MFDPRRARMLGRVKVASKPPKTGKDGRSGMGWRGSATSNEPSPVQGLEATQAWGGSSSDGGHLAIAQVLHRTAASSRQLTPLRQFSSGLPLPSD
eukprot:2531757-Rhodomonas_salina.1